MNIGKKIKTFRKKKKLSQEELSELTNIPRTSLGRYERGEKSPNVKTLKKICQALEVPMSSITDDEDYLQFVDTNIIDIHEISKTYFNELNSHLISLMKNNATNEKKYTMSIDNILKISFISRVLNNLNYNVKTDYENYAVIFDKSDNSKSIDITPEKLLQISDFFTCSLDNFIEKLLEDNLN